MVHADALDEPQFVDILARGQRHNNIHQGGFREKFWR